MGADLHFKRAFVVVKNGCMQGLIVIILGGSDVIIELAGNRAPCGVDDAERGVNASLVVSRDPSGRTDLTLAVTLSEPPGEGQVELLDFIAAVTAGVAAPAGSTA